MLNNMRSAYFRGKQFEKTAAVTDLLLEGFPENAGYYKARGWPASNASIPRRSERSGKTLKYAPDADDRMKSPSSSVRFTPDGATN